MGCVQDCVLLVTPDLLFSLKGLYVVLIFKINSIYHYEGKWVQESVQRVNSERRLLLVMKLKF